MSFIYFNFITILSCILALMDQEITKVICDGFNMHTTIRHNIVEASVITITVIVTCLMMAALNITL